MAEKRRRRTTEAPAIKAGNRLATKALPWKRGMLQYRTSSVPKARAESAAVRAARPWVMRTALGAPVDPAVKSIR